MLGRAASIVFLFLCVDQQVNILLIPWSTVDQVGGRYAPSPPVGQPLVRNALPAIARSRPVAYFGSIPTDRNF